MRSNNGPNDLASEWREAFNSHDLDRILALYSDDIVFKSPRVRTISGVESGVLEGKSAVRDYWRRLLERRPNLECVVGHVFVGVDSVALEYRFPSGLHGIEFMTVGSDGLVTFAVGNDLVG
jgi:ketosteroid isomerase-like protein